ncbi:putative monooxygenase p33MONOX isoform X2 [Denticeps clupeoides]|uniref:putative monooxygenase p33MONOX isoform X2 n=1 Tax=Denticeps clupeoides TaxID=299321 RepID=UPI0010A4A8A1|nr:putative monooxygenase p33MONOX isoform X2 [Denticeps clupeoides]
MVSRSGDIPALEGSTSDGILGGMSIPIGMARRAMSYDDNLEAPMSPPPSDMNISNLWRKPEDNEMTQSASTLHMAAKHDVPVVKTKASSVIMNSLITKQTQESMHKFEKQAGLTDTGYTPHKGLPADESHYHRMAESLHKLHVQSGDQKEDKQTSSAQSTPSSTPQSSPKQKRRGWFSQSSTASISSSEMSTSSSSSMDMGTTEGAAVERWVMFGPRPSVQRSSTDTGGFALQSYKGAQKPTPMEVMKAQATRLGEDPANLKAPKMEIPIVEGKKQMTRPHKIKNRDMNVLTPSGF